MAEGQVVGIEYVAPSPSSNRNPEQETLANDAKEEELISQRRGDRGEGIGSWNVRALKARHLKRRWLLAYASHAQG